MSESQVNKKYSFDVERIDDEKYKVTIYNSKGEAIESTFNPRALRGFTLHYYADHVWFEFFPPPEGK